jgi:multidrug efflux pump subunit AcrB
MCGRKCRTPNGSFPAGADEPTVNEVNISEFPVLVVTLSGNASERVLTRVAKELRDQIEEVSGVLEANLQGSRDEMVEVIIDPVKLSSYNLQLDQLIGGVSRQQPACRRRYAGRRGRQIRRQGAGADRNRRGHRQPADRRQRQRRRAGA